MRCPARRPHLAAVAAIGFVAAGPTYNHDMSPYAALAKDALKLVADGKMADAGKKADELEDKWDAGTEDLKEADAALWNLIDKQMDAAIEACKGSDAKKATTELNSFLDKLNRVPKEAPKPK